MRSDGTERSPVCGCTRLWVRLWFGRGYRCYGCFTTQKG